MAKFTDCGALEIEMLAEHTFVCMIKGHKNLIKHTNRFRFRFQFQICTNLNISFKLIILINTTQEIAIFGSLSKY